MGERSYELILTITHCISTCLLYAVSFTTTVISLHCGCVFSMVKFSCVSVVLLFTYQMLFMAESVKLAEFLSNLQHWGLSKFSLNITNQIPPPPTPNLPLVFPKHNSSLESDHVISNGETKITVLQDFR